MAITQDFRLSASPTAQDHPEDPGPDAKADFYMIKEHILIVYHITRMRRLGHGMIRIMIMVV